MKKLIVILTGLFVGLAVSAQTAEEIMEKMDSVMSGMPEDRMAVTFEIKIPVMGSFKTTGYTLGGKKCFLTTVKGITITVWTDGQTDWTYNSKNNEIEITNAKADRKNEDSSDEMDMFNGVTEGYDVSIKSQDAVSWTIQCTKSKTNKDKDSPKNMEVVVQKGTFYPVSLSAKVHGTSVHISDISYDVTEEQVTFNPALYPDAQIVDKR